MMRETLTVLHLVNTLQWGGVRRHVLDLRTGLATHGVRSVIAAWLPPNDILATDPDVHHLPLYDWSGRKKSVRGFFRSLEMLRALLRGERVDVVHMHSRYAAMLGRMAAGDSVGRVYTAHNVFDDLRWFPCYPRDIISPSEAVREHFLATVRGAERKRMYVVRHGVEIPESGVLKAELSPRFCIAGRLCEEKGLRILVDALRLLKDDGGDFPIIDIVGDGPLGHWLAGQVASSLKGMPVHLHGFLPDPLPLINGATALLFPSISLDSVGYINLEAMGMGVPVIASDLPVLRELVIPGGTGVLVPSGDPRALATAMRTAMSETAEFRRMGARARERVRAEHGIERMCAGTARVYREIGYSSPGMGRPMLR